MNKMPTYEELLEINYHLGERCRKLEAIVQEQELQIEEFLSASTMYKELYLELRYGIKR